MLNAIKLRNKRTDFVKNKECPIFALSFRRVANWQGLVAQLNRASDYGSEGFRFES